MCRTGVGGPRGPGVDASASISRPRGVELWGRGARFKKRGFLGERAHISGHNSARSQPVFKTLGPLESLSNDGCNGVHG